MDELENLDNLDKLDEALLHAVRSDEWKAIEKYLEINKEIVEDRLFNSPIVNKQTNVAVVFIKMRSVYQKLLDLPKRLEWDIWIAKLNEELDKLTEEFVKDNEG